jgi:hypothetical protein
MKSVQQRPATLASHIDVQGERIDLWVSDDRQQRLCFRVLGGACALDLIERGRREPIRLFYKIDDLRALLYRGEGVCAWAPGAGCAIGRWSGKVEIRYRGPASIDCSVNVGHYLVILGWLNNKLRASEKREKRAATNPGTP